MPCLGNNPNLENDYSLWDEFGYACFGLYWFYRKISELYDVYMIATFDENSPNDNNNPFQEYKDKLRCLFPSKDRMINNLFMPVRFETELIYKSGRVEIMPVAENLILAAIYQLAVTLECGDYKGIKICKCCNSQFFIAHNSSKYCYDCSPQKHYKRKLKSKVISNNGNEK